jgi:20S proteasome subunit beta 6
MATNTRCSASLTSTQWLRCFVVFCHQAKTLYSKRFFPFYTFNLLAGITPEGEPRVYGYDAIGSYDYQRYGVQGSGQKLMVGLLDNQFQRRFISHFLEYYQENKNIPSSPEEITTILIDAFQSAAERDIYTGDSVEVIILRVGQEPEKKNFKIRSD